jgi:glutamine amidotransferase
MAPLTTQQIIALSTNSRESAGCVLALHAAELVLPPVGDGAFGVGYYDSGELLARVAPREAGRPLDAAGELASIRADVLVLQTGPATASESARHDGAQPFRFQDWLFARTGEITGFPDFAASIRDAMPPFIRRGLRGDTPDEHFFHLFLAFLFDAGHIGRNNVGTAEIRRALGQAVAAFDAFAEAAGHRRSAFSAVVSDGYSLVAAGREVPVKYALVEGIRNCGLCRRSRDGSAADAVGLDHEEVRGVLVIAGSERPAAPPFARLDDGAVLAVTSDTKVEFHTLLEIAGR